MFAVKLRPCRVIFEGSQHYAGPKKNYQNKFHHMRTEFQWFQDSSSHAEARSDEFCMIVSPQSRFDASLFLM